MAINQQEEPAIAVPQVLVDAVRLAAVDLRARRSLSPPARFQQEGFLEGWANLFDWQDGSMHCPRDCDHTLRCCAAYMSCEAASLLRALLQREAPKRLGYGPQGSENVKAHPFFRPVNWSRLMARQMPSPFRPSVNHVDRSGLFRRCRMPCLHRCPIQATFHQALHDSLPTQVTCGLRASQ